MGIKFTHQCKGTQNNHDKNHICQIVANRDISDTFVYYSLILYNQACRTENIILV